MRAVARPAQSPRGPAPRLARAPLALATTAARARRAPHRRRLSRLRRRSITTEPPMRTVARTCASRTRATHSQGRVRVPASLARRRGARRLASSSPPPRARARRDRTRRDGTDPSPLSTPRPLSFPCARLEPNHTHFLMVDDGSESSRLGSERPVRGAPRPPGLVPARRARGAWPRPPSARRRHAGSGRCARRSRSTCATTTSPVTACGPRWWCSSSTAVACRWSRGAAHARIGCCASRAARRP